MNNLTEMRDIGCVNVTGIISEIEDIKQFASATKLQSYGGKFPDMTGSGGKSYPVGITRTRNRYLSNAAYESAVPLVTHRNKEFYDLFTREIGKKKSKTEAHVVVAKRLLFLVYSMMKNGKHYRERKPGSGKRGSLPVE